MTVRTLVEIGMPGEISLDNNQGTSFVPKF